MKFNCPCDEIIFPPPLTIPAGLKGLPRQFATFPEFRQIMLSTIGGKTALQNWRARTSDDFGVMLLEMWAYICDSIAFYDEVIANESYLRTSRQRASLRKLVGLLGYVPRPATSAIVDLAVFADGRQPLTLPSGTSFRSGAFPGSPPQVFELDSETKVHPFLNRWKLVRNRPVRIDGGQNLASVSLTSLLLEPSTVTLKTGQVFLFEVIGDSSKTQARAVKNISDYPASDGSTYKKLEWDGAISVAGSTTLNQIKLTAPTQTALLWRETPPPNWPGPMMTFGTTYALLDSVYQQMRSSGKLVFERDGGLQWYKAEMVYDVKIALPGSGDTTVKDKSGNVTAVVTPPTTYVPVTIVKLDALINDAARKSPGAANIGGSGYTDVDIHYGFSSAGRVVAPALTTLNPGDTLRLAVPFEEPQDKKSPNRFLLEDKNNLGAEITGGIDFTTGVVTLDQTSALPQPLTVPVEMYGNVVRASRGETVSAEIMGSGDASIPNQSFTLKKKPLTYVPSPTAGNESGAASTLKVYVNGVRWTEVSSFFGVPPEAQVYVVRQNDEAESIVTFGDGVRGARLITGFNNVLAIYRFGAGKLSPPAGSIHQMGKPVKGIKSVRNPVAASGGDDAEAASGLRTYAPRSALLLGRAVSIQDMEAAAATVGGVRAARVEWRWNQLRQRPVVQVWYIGASTVAATVSQKLRGLSDPATPIEVSQAQPTPVTLSISIEIDPRRFESDVLAAVRSALMDAETGLLAPERIGIGVALFRSRIFETVLEVPGAVAVNGLLWNSESFNQYGRAPQAGKYFDFENGVLLLNGKAGANG
jgi:hypothetical protein